MTQEHSLGSTSTNISTNISTKHEMLKVIFHPDNKSHARSFRTDINKKIKARQAQIDYINWLKQFRVSTFRRAGEPQDNPFINKAFLILFLQLSDLQVNTLNKEIKQLEKLKIDPQTIINKYKDSKDHFDTHLLKQVPIQDLVQNHTPLERPRHISNRIYALCPFPDHQDTNSSFTIYKHNNSFYCFGCKRSGDNIAFTKQFFNLNFKEACKYIQQYLWTVMITNKTTYDEHYHPHRPLVPPYHHKPHATLERYRPKFLYLFKSLCCDAPVWSHFVCFQGERRRIRICDECHNFTQAYQFRASKTSIHNTYWPHPSFIIF